jgi:hypothetical protein
MELTMKTTTEQVATFAAEITEAYLADGRDHSAAELAAITGRPLRTVRALLTEVWRHRIRSYETTRPTFSRDYPTMEAGVARINLHGPDRERLAALVLAARSARLA